MKRTSIAIASAILLALLSGCGGGGTPEAKSPGKGKSGENAEVKPVAAEAAKGFNTALESMVAHDKANDWSEATCADVAKQFLDASNKQKSEMKHDFPEALYNAGLAYQRCDQDAQAKGQFQAALDVNQQFHHARVQLALYDLKEKGDPAVESVIMQLMQAVQDAKF